MARIETAGWPVELPARSSSTWRLDFSKVDDALGPHLILNKVDGSGFLFIYLDADAAGNDELDKLFAWANELCQ